MIDVRLTTSVVHNVSEKITDCELMPTFLGAYFYFMTHGIFNQYVGDIMVDSFHPHNMSNTKVIYNTDITSCIARSIRYLNNS